MLMTYLWKYVFQAKWKADIKVFDMVTRINEDKTLVKHKCKFDSATCNSNQKWNNDKCQCECKINYTCK